MSKPERHGTIWSTEEEKRLYEAFIAGTPIEDIAETHQRTSGGIRGCLQKLGFLDEEGNVISPQPEFTPSAASLKREAKAAAKAAKRKFTAPKQESLSPQLNERFREALRLMEETNDNLFITGKAGTGKSTLLTHFCRTTNKQPVVLAPTGIAALHVKGQTIHSFFNFYVDVTPEKIRQKKGKPRNAKLFKKLKTIVIDEVSMVRADILDCIDAFLRLHGRRPGRIFGGVQMIFIGDLYQLPPVVSAQEREMFASHYRTPYFFSAHALADNPPELIELQKVYRQKDQDFVDLLNKVRNNSVHESDIARINSRLVEPSTTADGNPHITLTTTNAVADSINDTHLAALEGELYTSAASIQGQFGKEYFPTSTDLQYKIGAQIMLLNNDSDKRWVNGSIGVIEDIEQDEDGVEYLVVRLQQNRTLVEVYPHTWEVYKFGVEDGSILSEPVGTFTQQPFRLAWAITIHKSQGKTFGRVHIDIGRGAFATGQMYVALSRCTSFEGLSLKTPIRLKDIQTDPQIISFLASHDRGNGAQNIPVPEKIAIIQKAIEENVALEITYLKADDTETSSKVIPRTVGPAKYQDMHYEGMKAFCTLRQQELTFRVDRILNISRLP